ncbi:hypothetical protein MLD52_03710 [Puniceicoccaceae bacterium K14]|nr:hypothetical protein [Puniceicoccaceae bacterium K14]
MKVAVQDANILIDLELSGLLDLWFQLGIETHTTNLVCRELRKGSHIQALSYVKNGSILETIISFEDLLEVDRIHRSFEPKGAGVVDASVLFLAMQKGAMLLTGDKPLRHEAEVKYRIEVHGTIWILDQLVLKGVIQGVVAADKLEYLIGLTGEQKRRLPRKQSSEYIAKWRGI